MNRRGWIGTSVLVVVLLGAAGGLTAWKRDSLRQADVAAAHQPEPMESIEVAVAQEREHRRSTTSIGTVMALRSVTLRNELAGTVREVALDPGAIVEEGTLLVALDVAVEEAELEAQKAQATLAETLLGRMQRARDNRGASDADVDRAKAERDIAQAQIERTKAMSRWRPNCSASSGNAFLRQFFLKYPSSTYRIRPSRYS